MRRVPPRYVRRDYGHPSRFPDSGGCLLWLIAFITLCMILGYLK